MADPHDVLQQIEDLWTPEQSAARYVLGWLINHAPDAAQEALDEYRASIRG